MATLIIRTAEGLELGRRPMQASERYLFYRACSTGEDWEHRARRYRVVSVAWKMASEDCVCSVRDVGPALGAYEDD